MLIHQYRRPALKQQGFTLIELMVVVAILAILIGVVMPNVMKNPEKARVTAAKAQIKIIQSQMEAYQMDNFKYPTTDEGIKALVEKPSGAKNWSGYLKRQPVDPWGNKYKYINPGTRGGDIDIYSLGIDGEPGNDDVGNWTAKE
ncbi:MAG: type II secretion system major pseudopilin GspG [Thiotrichaceae bacterium]|nr:type II secretion system major pseudopilin GspG [Thiotrichaceae bacterium]